MTSENTTAFPWNRLVPELRLMVLQEAMKLAPDAGKNPLALWSCVSTEWYNYLTPTIWHSIKLWSSHEGSNFDSDWSNQYATVKNRKLIRELSLDVRLMEYSCPECGSRESRHTKNQNNATFSDSIRRLFGTLCSWTTYGIAFNLNAFSSSDLKHRRLSFAKHKRELAGQSPRYSIKKAKKRLSGYPLDIQQYETELPVVTAIRSFSMDSGSTRSLSQRSAYRLMASLLHLQHVNYETWSAAEETYQDHSEGTQALFLSWASHLTDVRSVTLHEQPPPYNIPDNIYYRAPNVSLTNKAAVAAFYLNDLSIRSALDAADFFRAFCEAAESKSDWRTSGSWPRLRRLALTCDVRKVCRTREGIDDLLLAAGKAAAYLPSLETMEVWAPGKGEGFFFRYEVGARGGTLTVGSTPWYGVRRERPKKVHEAWIQALLQQSYGFKSYFVYFFREIDAKTLGTQTSICSHLKLKDLMPKEPTT